HGRAGRADSRPGPAHHRNDRQLLGGPHALDTLHSHAPVSGIGSAPGFAGVVQNFRPYEDVTLLQPTEDAAKKPVTTQTLPMGPAASQIAIKQIGTNGGGFFNANGAHPYENPTPFSNFLEMLAILLIPAALCYTFGMMVGDTRQGWAIL